MLTHAVNWICLAVAVVMLAWPAVVVVWTVLELSN
jgi:hypothetical protein